ncbi:MAG: hypothetical protein AAF515_05060 [Pseudomonadota bacterium]
MLLSPADIEGMFEALGELCRVNGREMYGLFSLNPQLDDVEFNVGNRGFRLESDSPTLVVPSHQVIDIGERAEVLINPKANGGVGDSVQLYLRGARVVYIARAVRHDGSGIAEIELGERGAQ